MKNQQFPTFFFFDCYLSSGFHSRPIQAGQIPTTLWLSTLPMVNILLQLTVSEAAEKAGVASPALMLVKDARAYVQLTWSSPNYDYMLVNGDKYLNEASDGGNSQFTVPIMELDQPLRTLPIRLLWAHPMRFPMNLPSIAIRSIQRMHFLRKPQKSSRDRPCYYHRRRYLKLLFQKRKAC